MKQKIDMLCRGNISKDPNLHFPEANNQQWQLSDGVGAVNSGLQTKTTLDWRHNFKRE